MQPAYKSVGRKGLEFLKKLHSPTNAWVIFQGLVLFLVYFNRGDGEPYGIWQVSMRV